MIHIQQSGSITTFELLVVVVDYNAQTLSQPHSLENVLLVLVVNVSTITSRETIRHRPEITLIKFSQED